MAWEPFDDLNKFKKDIKKSISWMTRSFEDSFNEVTKKIKRFNLKEPKTEISQRPDEVDISLDLPNMTRKDIFLQVTEDHLEVSAQKRSKVKINKKGFSSEEAAFTGYRRVIPLPTNVVPEKAVATFKNGRLTVKIPKSKKKTVKTVTVD